MPFGLKNVGSTYQRMITRMFESLLGKNMEVYIDDMVVKSKKVLDYLGDLQIVIEILRSYKLRLNASKCSFGVGSGKFLGYMVTHRGIEVNPDQIKAITNMRTPRNPKVQKLTGMAAALNRFILDQQIDADFSSYWSKNGRTLNGQRSVLKPFSNSKTT